MSLTDTDLIPFQKAIFERFDSHKPFKQLCFKHNVDDSKLRRMYHHWLTESPPEAQPLGWKDISLQILKSGRPRLFSNEEELLIAEAIRYYDKHLTALSKRGVLDLASHVSNLFPVPVRTCPRFENDKTPSLSWLNGFLARHSDINVKTMQGIKCKRTEAVTIGHIGEHI